MKWTTEWRGSGEMRMATASGRGGVGRSGTARMEEGVRGIYRRGQELYGAADKPHPRGSRAAVSGARQGCLSRAVREVGDGLTGGARLAAVAIGGERGWARSG